MTEPCPALLAQAVLRITRDVVCETYEVTWATLIQRNRQPVAVEPRQVLWWAARTLVPSITLHQLGDFLKRNHTTPIGAVQSIERKRAANEWFRVRTDAVLSACFERAQSELGAGVVQKPSALEAAA